LRLNPAELGPVHVRVELRADQASIQIVAASPETRSALEQSLPQLRDLLAGQGITLGQATVHDGAAQREARPDMWASTRLPAHDDGSAAASDTVELVVRQPNRLVDVFA
jgi:flagellar hook-length control protein FliK